MEQLAPLVASHKHDFAAVISHRLPLREGPNAYRRFAAKECLKVVFDPWA